MFLYFKMYNIKVFMNDDMHHFQQQINYFHIFSQMVST